MDIAQPQNIPVWALQGNPDRIIQRLQWMKDTLDFDVMITGHASPRTFCTKDDLSAQQAYFRDLSDAIAAARAAGLADKSPEMAASVRTALTPKYGSWRRFEDLALNVEGMIDWRAQAE